MKIEVYHLLFGTTPLGR